MTRAHFCACDHGQPSGLRAITVDIALRFARFFGTSSQNIHLTKTKLELRVTIEGDVRPRRARAKKLAIALTSRLLKNFAHSVFRMMAEWQPALPR